MSEKYKKQHIVPQAYLKRFATEKNGNYLIGVRLKPKTNKKVNIFAESIKNVGYIENYYDTCSQQDKKHWEHYLDENFDSLCGTPLSNVISKITMSMPDTLVISKEDRQILSRIMLSQMVRVPDFLDYHLNKSIGLVDSYKNDFLNTYPTLSEDKKKLVKNISFSTNTTKNIILSSIFNKARFDDYCRILSERTWIVFYNSISTSMPFITSDNPVIVKDTANNDTSLKSCGIANNTAVFFYPISPKILIALYPRQLYFGAIAELDSRVQPVDEMKFIIDINTSIIRNCYRHAFLPKTLYTEVKPDDRRLTNG